MDNLKIGVIGIGNIGTAHARCLYDGKIKGAILSAICDISKDRVDYCKDVFDNTNVFTSYKDLIDSHTVDAVIVSVPHPLHSKISIYALKNGVHVLTEKPVDISVKKALELNKVAEQSGKVFSVMFNQRTTPIFKKAREIVKSGELGELKRSVWIITNWYRTQSYYNSSDWRATWKGEGGGVLLNQAPHNLDLWQWICGMPTEITAFCDVAKYHNIEVEDDVTIFARYENGATGSFITSTGEYPGTNRLEISGDLGKIVLENGMLKWWKLKQSVLENIKTSQKSFDKIDCDYFEFEFENNENPHGDMIQNFVNAILNGEELISNGTDGILELSISNAAYLSSWTKCSVRLPFDIQLFENLLSEHVQNSNTITSAKNNTTVNYSDRWLTQW